ncbi:MAG TPA: Rid family hydrolase [Myxococcales bacterium]|nr:Rid family hydrolase [Myxococcales bacterium]
MLKKEIIRTSDAPRSPVFSQAVKAGSMVYLSGIIGLDPATNQMSGSTIQEQTRQSLRNCQAILAAAGATLDDVVEVHALLARPGEFAGMNEEYTKFFQRDPPARAVSRLGVELPNVLVSIKMTAIVPDGHL